MAAEDGGGAVELLREHDARKPVRQSDGTERELEMGGARTERKPGARGNMLSSVFRT